VTAADGHRVWILARDWFAVELIAGGTDDRCANVYIADGALRCTCPNGRRLIGCPHILAVGEQHPGGATRVEAGVA
jgi:hypothetical protein